VRHQVLALTLGGLVISVSAHAQLAEEFSVPRAANCCLLGTAVSLAEQLQDWNQLGRYYQANKELKAQPREKGRVVFMGDSITDGWRLAEAFPGKPFVNRGISGQTTAQMLVRMYPDVIALKPDAVIILAGTNDVARNNGPQTLEQIQQNLMAMAELAKAHDIKVIFSAVMPISDTAVAAAPAGRGAGQGPAGPGPGFGRAAGPRIQSVQRPPADILKLNAWLKTYADSIKAGYADYYAAVVDEKGFFRQGYTNDGLHPNAQGYTLMNPVAVAAIEKILR
jgi:lysophospholipase L1-like esterase